MTRRREYFKYESRYQTIRGRFYVEGKLVRRSLGTFAEINVAPDGKLQPIAKRAWAKLYPELEARSKAMEAKLLTEGAVHRRAGQSIKALMQQWVDISAALRAPKTVEQYIHTADRYIRTYTLNDQRSPAADLMRPAVGAAKWVPTIVVSLSA